jgi:hypothetical protein
LAVGKRDVKRLVRARHADGPDSSSLEFAVRHAIVTPSGDIGEEGRATLTFG